jgi:hypothetical protein
MVEQDAVADEHAVRLPIVDAGPVGIELGDGIRTARVKRSALVLRRRTGTEHLRGRRLVQPRRHAGHPQSLEDPHGSQPGHVAGVGRQLEADLHVALGGQVIDLRRLDRGDQAHEPEWFVKISVVERQAVGDPAGVEVVQSRARQGARAPDEPVHVVALFEEKLRKVRAILACDARDERDRHCYRAVATASVRSIPRSSRSESCCATNH